MKNKGYQHFVDTIIEKEPIDTPIYTADVAKKMTHEFGLPMDKAKVYTNVALKRTLEKGNTRRFVRGVYYKPIKSVFGEKPLNGDKLALQQLMEKELGYITGATLLNKLGLSTLLPREIQVATNKYNVKFPYQTSVTPIKPPTKVTPENIKYLQLLDAIKWMNKLSTDAVAPQALIKEIAKEWGCDHNKLILLANKYYKAETLSSVVEVLLGEETQHEVTQTQK